MHTGVDLVLVDKIVNEVKSQGVFDQFRKDSMADVDTKPAYQNLRQRVESTVGKFLAEQKWKSDLNKFQLREKLRKHIVDAGFLDTGVERIVDQVVNPKISTVFEPKIEDIAYNYLGIEKPHRSPKMPCLNGSLDIKTDLLPTDLEAVSPDSDKTKSESKEDIFNESIEDKNEEFESPPFEPIEGVVVASSPVKKEENSDHSQLSGISGLTSQDSVSSEHKESSPPPKFPANTTDTQPESELSEVSSNSRLSIVTNDENNSEQASKSHINKPADVDISEEAQMPKFSENSGETKVQHNLHFDIKREDIKFEGTERNCDNHHFNFSHHSNNDIKSEDGQLDSALKSEEKSASSHRVGEIKQEKESPKAEDFSLSTKHSSTVDDEKNESAAVDMSMSENESSQETNTSGSNSRNKKQSSVNQRSNDSRHGSYRPRPPSPPNDYMLQKPPSPKYYMMPVPPPPPTPPPPPPPRDELYMKPPLPPVETQLPPKPPSPPLPSRPASPDVEISLRTHRDDFSDRKPNSPSPRSPGTCRVGARTPPPRSPDTWRVGARTPPPEGRDSRDVVSPTKRTAGIPRTPPSPSSYNQQTRERTPGNSLSSITPSPPRTTPQQHGRAETYQSENGTEYKRARSPPASPKGQSPSPASPSRRSPSLKRNSPIQPHQNRPPSPKYQYGSDLANQASNFEENCDDDYVNSPSPPPYEELRPNSPSNSDLKSISSKEASFSLSENSQNENISKPTSPSSSKRGSSSPQDKHKSERLDSKSNSDKHLKPPSTPPTVSKSSSKHDNRSSSKSSSHHHKSSKSSKDDRDSSKSHSHRSSSSSSSRNHTSSSHHRSSDDKRHSSSSSTRHKSSKSDSRDKDRDRDREKEKNKRKDDHSSARHKERRRKSTDSNDGDGSRHASRHSSGRGNERSSHSSTTKDSTSNSNSSGHSPSNSNNSCKDSTQVASLSSSKRSRHESRRRDDDDLKYFIVTEEEKQKSEALIKALTAKIHIKQQTCVYLLDCEKEVQDIFTDTAKTVVNVDPDCGPPPKKAAPQCITSPSSFDLYLASIKCAESKNGQRLPLENGVSRKRSAASTYRSSPIAFSSSHDEDRAESCLIIDCIQYDKPAKKLRNNSVGRVDVSPTSSDLSVSSKENEYINEKQKRTTQSGKNNKMISGTVRIEKSNGNGLKMNNQRYSSEDLYKPRPFIQRPRRRELLSNPELI